MSSYQDRLLRAIPGGAHTYSRGFDQFPKNAPEILSSGRGAYVFDPQGKSYLDYGMGLRAVNIGYAENEINMAAIEQINFGNNLTRASIVELEAAELFVSLIDSVDMVKFTKNGSTAVSAAVKLARAYTGRDMVALCKDHPFFSYDDWFIGSTPLTLGIPQDTIAKTKTFKYNDIESLEALINQYPNQFSCIVLEPATIEEPKPGYLKQIQELCRNNGIVFVLDEMITGFRWHIKGAQHLYDVKPDLCTFGKAMANGFSLACVAGKREIMELGSIEFEGQERLFLLSSTHGAEMSALGAFVATVKFMQKNNVIDHIWNYGTRLMQMMKKKAQNYGIENSFKVGGSPCSPYYSTLDLSGKISFEMRTLFLQEMVKNGVLMPWIAISFRHGDDEFSKTEIAIEKTFEIYHEALNKGFENYLQGPSIKPVFRKYN